VPARSASSGGVRPATALVNPGGEQLPMWGAAYCLPPTPWCLLPSVPGWSSAATSPDRQHHSWIETHDETTKRRADGANCSCVGARIDPVANKVVARISVGASWGPLVTGVGAVWVVSTPGPGPSKSTELTPTADRLERKLDREVRSFSWRSAAPGETSHNDSNRTGSHVAAQEVVALDHEAVRRSAAAFA